MFILKLFFNIFFSMLYTFFLCIFLRPLFYTNNINIDLIFTKINLYSINPKAWSLLKSLYPIFSFFSSLIIFNSILNIFFKHFSNIKKTSISPIPSGIYLYIGKNSKNENYYLPEAGLFQNILITGTIGSGKTSSAMYPFTKQLISFDCENNNKKIGMLILDVKGNYHKQVYEYCKEFSREDDLIIIGLDNNSFYNPLDKPNLSAQVLANRLKTILTLFSKNNSESYWLDKCEEILAEAIKLCRIYNNGYVTFKELHNIIFIPNYISQKLTSIRFIFQSGKMNQNDVYNLLSSLKFFYLEFFSLDSRVSSILKSEIGRIINVFISNYSILNTFCPPKEKINLFGFQDVIKKGKIVVLNMNISEHRNLSKIIAAYLKLDFQTEIMLTLSSHSNMKSRPTAFICDEYHEYVTSTDADFFAQSREAKCINIVATQSYTSILNTLKDTYSTKVIIQNLINKLWFRTDDMFSIEEAQKQIGKEDKIKTSKSISENAKETHYNYIFNKFQSKDSNISESINTYKQLDYVYNTNFFTQDLETFSCLAFLSTGSKIIKPCKLYLEPYFKKASIKPKYNIFLKHFYKRMML